MKRMKLVGAWIVALFLLQGTLIPQSIVRADNLTPGTTEEPQVPPTPSPSAGPASVGGSPEVPPGYTLIEGDILVPTSDTVMRPDGTSVPPRSRLLWPNGIVPYEFNANVVPANRQLMRAAMNDWEAVGNIHFNEIPPGTPRPSDYVEIRNSSGNNSMVGKRSGQQIINIFSWNEEFVMAHELGHTLGLWHEQSRPKRDQYIVVNYQNVSQTECNGSCNSQFDIPASDVSFYGPYDFDSVMHYNECEFSRYSACPNDPTAPNGGRTIVVQPAYQSSQSLIGQRTHLSRLDRLTTGFLYPYSNWKFLDASGPPNGDGSFSSPFNDYRTAIAQTPDGGTLWIQPGTYSAVGVYGKRIIIQAPLGGVVLR